MLFFCCSAMDRKLTFFLRLCRYFNGFLPSCGSSDPMLGEAVGGGREPCDHNVLLGVVNISDVVERYTSDYRDVIQDNGHGRRSTGQTKTEHGDAARGSDTKYSEASGLKLHIAFFDGYFSPMRDKKYRHPGIAPCQTSWAELRIQSLLIYMFIYFSVLNSHSPIALHCGGDS